MNIRYRVELRQDERDQLTALLTGLMAEGFISPAACHWLIHTSPSAGLGRSWLVMAMTTISGLARL